MSSILELPTQLPVQRKPQKQRSFHTFQIPISAILADLGRYKMPEQQRLDVWPVSYRKVFIEHLLEGLPVEPLHFHKVVCDNGIVYFEVVNGRQRLTTIKMFRNNEFTTLTPGEANRYDIAREDPIEPGRTFEHLTAASQNALVNFELTVQCLEDLSPREISIIFQRSNRYVYKTTTAENLSSHSSLAAAYAHKIIQHSFWSEIYVGEKLRRQDIQGSYFPIVLEKEQRIYSSLGATLVNDYGYGYKDKELTDILLEKVLERLDMVTHLFYRSTIRTNINIIPMYQSVMLLEREGIHPLECEQGCLTSWFADLLRHDYGYGYGSSFRKLVNINAQRGFWEDNLSKVLDICKSKRFYAPMPLVALA